MEDTTYINPQSWGNGAWIFLHCITYTYPEFPTEQEQKHYEAFFNQLGYVIPCPNCREHYREWCKKFPCGKFLKNRYTLSKWLYEMHNFVNYKLRKPLIYDFDTSQQLVLKQIMIQQQRQQQQPSSSSKKTSLLYKRG